MTLSFRDLPLDFDNLEINSDSIRKQYIHERNNIRSAKGLRTFVQRWRALWSFRIPDGSPDAYDLNQLLVTGRFNHRKVYRTFRKIMAGKAKISTKSRLSHFAVEILCPGYMTICITLPAMRYMVPENGIWAQRFPDEYPW